MEAPLSSVRRDDEIDIRLSEREIEAVSLGLRTLLLTMADDEALCGVATAALRPSIAWPAERYRR